MKTKIEISDFSEHLFWDVDKSKLNFTKHKEQIVYQVVEYGLMKDWQLLQCIFTFDELKQIVVQIRGLDKVTLSFLSFFFKLEKTDFTCYTQSQSTQNFWNS